MRLIDADELLEYIEKEKAQIPIDAAKYHIDEEAVEGMNAAVSAMKYKIKEMPTAYVNEKGYWADAFGLVWGTVLVWQPLPAPYKEGCE